MTSPGSFPDVDGFRPAPWLPGPHLQTIWGRASRARRLIPMRREIVAAQDGDELILDHAGPSSVAVPPESPVVLILHGLEGSSNSVYVQGLMHEITAAGWRATAVNFRSCARDPADLARWIPNRAARLYHSGETSDLDYLLKTLAARNPGLPMAAVGVSIGGNILLKWLGENPGQTLLGAAATMSVPYDLAASAIKLETAAGRLYTRVFLKTLKAKIREVTGRSAEASGRVDTEAAFRATTFRDFDDAATAPLHGFAGADEYYAVASSINYVDRVTTPCLCLSAADDPFLPAEVLPQLRDAVSDSIRLVVTERGGHAGFISGSRPWAPIYWGETHLVRWLQLALE